MSAFYYPFFQNVGDILNISGDEFKHIKVQRKLNKQIKLTNGLGLLAFAEPITTNKDSIDLRIIELFPNYNENRFSSTLFFGLIDDKNRIEFIIEKVTELGVNDVFPVVCENSQFTKFDLKRSERKAIAAIKQAERSVLPVIHSPIKFSELGTIISNYKFRLLADFNGMTDCMSVDGDVAFFVGPEGGFSKSELDFLYLHCEKVKLANAVLRTETASISIFNKVIL